VYGEVNWSPDARALRHFGWGLGVGCAVLTAVLAWKTGAAGAAPRVAGAAAAALLALATVRSTWLLYPYRAWTAVTVPIGFALQCLALGLFFYAVLTPVAVCCRIRHRDCLGRSFEPGKDSYWAPRTEEREPRRYFRQY
jgi:hypothetical protein